MENSASQSSVDRIKALVHPILFSMGIELVDIEQKGSGQRVLLRIVVDKAGGITLKDCQEASVYIGHALEVDDVIPVSYRLEVSSPGLDRPLVKREDYQRSLGKLIRIQFKEPQDGQWDLVGRIIDLDSEGITVEEGDTLRREVPLADIQQARLEIEW